MTEEDFQDFTSVPIGAVTLSVDSIASSSNGVAVCVEKTEQASVQSKELTELISLLADDSGDDFADLRAIVFASERRISELESSLRMAQKEIEVCRREAKLSWKATSDFLLKKKGRAISASL
jgi:hypothetical protein